MSLEFKLLELEKRTRKYNTKCRPCDRLDATLDPTEAKEVDRSRERMIQVRTSDNV